MDNFLIQAVVTELEPLLSGRRPGRIYQSGATDLLIDFSLRNGKLLFISTDPQRLAVYVTSQTRRQISADTRTDTQFVSICKKYLGDFRLEGIEKIGYDRIVIFTFDSIKEDGDDFKRKLIVYLTGRSANCLLIEGSKIIASLRDREDATETYKEPDPPGDKLDPFQCSDDRLTELIEKADGDVETAAGNNLIGFTREYAEELALRSEKASPGNALREILAEVSSPQPLIYSNAGLEDIRNEPGMSEFSLTVSLSRMESHSTKISTEYSSVNEALDEYYKLLTARREFLAKKQGHVSAVSAKIKKQKTLIANLNRELAGFADMDKHRRYGELLLASLTQATKTDKGFSVINLYDESQPVIEIPSAGKATPGEAAEHYFKLAKKARHGQEVINARLPGLESELASLLKHHEKLIAVTRMDELNKLAGKEGPVTAKYEREKPKSRPSPKSKPKKLTGIRQYLSSDGFEILVGRADKDNDYLTLRIAKSFDLWFHAADYPGSHVVLRNPQRKQVPNNSIIQAAQLAAKFSQAKGGAKVAVNYCEKKFVSKPKGFAPGQVRLSSYKTVMVEPAETAERI